MNKLASTEFATFATNTAKSLIAGFPVGTRVRTEHGERSIETLQAGDRIITRHGKLAEIKSVMSGNESPKDRPILIGKGALGGGLPRRDVLMAPDQDILLADPLLEQLFDCTTAMVTPRDLLSLDGVEEAENITPLAYVQVECETPEVLFCSGLACISNAASGPFDQAPKLNREQTKTYLAQL